MLSLKIAYLCSAFNNTQNLTMKGIVLYDLIQGMSKEEKRFFKLYSKFHSGEKYYISLFDVLDSAKSYTEDLLKKFAKENHLPQNAANVRNYLGEILTDALVDFKRKNSPHYQFQKAVLLHERKFHDEALQIIKKIKNEFEEPHKNSLLLDVISLEMSLVLKNEYILDNAEKMLLLSKEYNNTASYIHIYAESVYIGTKAFYLLRQKEQSKLNVEELLEFEKEFSESYVLQYDIKQIPTQLALIVIGSLRKGYILLGYTDKLEKFLTDCVNFFNNTDNLKRGNELTTMAALLELAYVAFDLKNETSYLFFLNKLYSFPLSNKFNQTNQYANYYTLLLLGHVLFEKDIPAIELQAIAAFLIEQEDKIELRKKIGIRKHLATYYFCKKRYSECIDYTNQVLDFKIEKNDFYYFDIWMLFVISHLELGNYTIIENNVRNVYRKLRDHELLQPHQKSILLAFKYFYEKKITIKNYRLFYNAIEDILQQEKTLYYMAYWIEQKLLANKINENAII